MKSNNMHFVNFVSPGTYVPMFGTVWHRYELVPEFLQTPTWFMCRSWHVQSEATQTASNQTREPRRNVR